MFLTVFALLWGGIPSDFINGHKHAGKSAKGVYEVSARLWNMERVFLQATGEHVCGWHQDSVAYMLTHWEVQSLRSLQLE